MNNLLGDTSCYLFLCTHGTYMISQNTIDFFKNFYIFFPLILPIADQNLANNFSAKIGNLKTVKMLDCSFVH